MPVKTLAVIVLKLPDGRLVLQRRTTDAPVAAGKLGFFGGHIETGETPEQCVRRELAEETSLDVDSLAIIPKVEFQLPANVNYAQDRHFHIFESTIPQDDFEAYEGVRAESYTTEELLQRDDVSEVVIQVLKHHVR